MREITKTSLAASDTREIVDYLLEHSEPAADRFIVELEAVLRLLGGQPRMGRVRDDLVLGSRTVVIGKYLVFYPFTDEEVQILRILHGSRDITPEMFDA